MRWRRYSLLALAVAGSLAGLAVLARHQAAAYAKERAGLLAAELAADLQAFDEHARHLARLDPKDALRHVAAFRGLARVRVYAADGAEVVHAARYGDLVAAMPEGRLGRAPEGLKPPPREGDVRFSGLQRDEEREDLDPALRNVLAYVARRPGGGAVVLSVYAEPFLAPLRRAGAGLSVADVELLPPPRPPFASREVEGRRLSVPVRLAQVPVGVLLALAGVALGVLLLAAAAVFVSERQVRAAERAAIERRLAGAERLHALGLLTAGIAHEINNPLAGIGNWLRLGDTEKVKEGLERIRRIVADLLSFARPGGERGAADVAACVRRALDLARSGGRLRDVPVACEVPEGLAADIAPHSLEQVLLNLLLNADAAGAGRVDIAARERGGRVLVEVRDHGPGVAPEDLPRLFDPFFTRRNGTGLGLSVSYGILKAVGGDLRAENAQPGARFTLELGSRAS